MTLLPPLPSLLLFVVFLSLLQLVIGTFINSMSTMPSSMVTWIWPTRGVVCRLLKSLYESKLSFVLLLASYSQSDVDHSLFIRTQGSSFTVVLVYVDDLLIAGNDLTIITNLKTFLADQFKLKDLEPLNTFLILRWHVLLLRFFFFNTNMFWTS